MSSLLTNGEHDSMWRDVMGHQVPYGVEYLKHILNQIGYQNQITIMKELYSEGVLTKKEYLNGLIDLGNGSKLFGNEEEANKYRERIK